MYRNLLLDNTQKLTDMDRATIGLALKEVVATLRERYPHHPILIKREAKEFAEVYCKIHYITPHSNQNLRKLGNGYQLPLFGNHPL